MFTTYVFTFSRFFRTKLKDTKRNKNDKLLLSPSIKEYLIFVYVGIYLCTKECLHTSKFRKIRTSFYGRREYVNSVILLGNKL
jgi:hypothetical protein